MNAYNEWVNANEWAGGGQGPGQSMMPTPGSGKYFKPGTARRNMRGFLFWNILQSANRHYEATGDLNVAAKAGARAWVRWGAFYLFGLFFNLYFVGVTALAVPIWANRITHAPADIINSQAYQAGLINVPSQSSTSTSLTLLACVIAAYVALLPYTVGVMWVRNADRSLYRVNHWKVYKLFLPFAFRMRRFPDWLLYGLWLPLILVLSHVLGGALG